MLATRWITTHTRTTTLITRFGLLPDVVVGPEQGAPAVGTYGYTMLHYSIFVAYSMTILFVFFMLSFAIKVEELVVVVHVEEVVAEEVDAEEVDAEEVDAGAVDAAANCFDIISIASVQLLGPADCAVLSVCLA